MVLGPAAGGGGRDRLRETLCAGRFTAADIVNGYALRLADNIGLAKDFGPNVAAYWARLQERDGYKRAVAAERKAGVEQNVAARVRADDAVIPGNPESRDSLPRSAYLGFNVPRP